MEQPEIKATRSGHPGQSQENVKKILELIYQLLSRLDVKPFLDNRQILADLRRKISDL